MKRSILSLILVATLAVSSGSIGEANRLPNAIEPPAGKPPAVTTQPIRMVNSNAPIQSWKRGIGTNALSGADFRVLAPGVSWYYNWGATPLVKPPDVAMDYLPIAWNDDPDEQITEPVRAGLCRSCADILH